MNIWSLINRKLNLPLPKSHHQYCPTSPKLQWCDPEKKYNFLSSFEKKTRKGYLNKVKITSFINSLLNIYHTKDKNFEIVKMTTFSCIHWFTRHFFTAGVYIPSLLPNDLNFCVIKHPFFCNICTAKAHTCEFEWNMLTFRIKLSGIVME